MLVYVDFFVQQPCTERYYVLKVIKDNIRMSDFTEQLPSKKFDNGRLFYEFTEDEDLISYKEVVSVQQEDLIRVRL